MNIINTAFGYVMKFCYSIIPNYALAILLFAILIKIVLFPLGIKQQKNMQKQASLRPKEMAIRKRYAGRTDKATQQKMQQEVMDLYQKEHYSMFSGCLPLVIQFPIIIALYNVIRNPLTYLLDIGKDNIEAIKTMFTSIYPDIKVTGEIDMFTKLHENFDAFASCFPEGFTAAKLPSFKIFGIFDLSQTPSLSDASWLLIIPIATFFISFISMKLTRKFSYQAPQNDQAGNAGLSMKIMDFTMPLFSVWITFTVPAVVGLYWIFQNVLSTVQQFILSKMFKIPVFTEEEYKQAEKEMNGSVKKEKKKKSESNSLHHIDDDDEDYSDPAPAKEAPVLKADRDGSKPELKDGAENPKVKSLHHIDDEDY